MIGRTPPGNREGGEEGLAEPSGVITKSPQFVSPFRSTNRRESSHLLNQVDRLHSRAPNIHPALERVLAGRDMGNLRESSNTACSRLHKTEVAGHVKVFHSAMPNAAEGNAQPDAGRCPPAFAHELRRTRRRASRPCYGSETWARPSLRRRLPPSPRLRRTGRRAGRPCHHSNPRASRPCYGSETWAGRP